jgi:hypothetical protein
MAEEIDVSPDLDKYYYYLNMITENVRNGYNDMVLKYCEMSLPLIPRLIAETIKSSGEFDITTIPAIELGAKIWSLEGNEEKIGELERLIDAHAELTPWKIHIERAYERLGESGE